ncbi:uncharacterized protein PAC_03601 [Phialocephala subalpina]|uniref:Heterokaryon incompatibility domain-containing protein n=1 Tax=Phialocephala subalpina TaxID=576137 RepID=A0A1L7WLS4_9HELO|nr:uncharacterized protein PAC_03601 [Phialocephala subalpina]
MPASSELYASFPIDRSTTQIRLIRLQPRCASDKVLCFLDIGDLNSGDCKYEALSYEWGPAKSSKFSITLEEEFPVRENLYWALWYLRQDRDERLLWIDALCIDQKNEKERNHQKADYAQVSQMGKVYSKATRVIAWLGVGGEHHDASSSPDAVSRVELEAALSFIKLYCGSYGRPTTDINEDLPSNSPAEKKYESSIAYIKQSRTTCATILKLFSKTYWTRLWIIQELVLTRHIMLRIGKYDINWNDLVPFFARPPDITSGCKFSRYSVWNRLQGATPVKILQQRRDHQSWSHGRFDTMDVYKSLFDVFQAYKDALCLDIRDKVFGLRGLSAMCCQKASPVDCSRSAAEICEGLVDHYFRYHQVELALRVQSKDFYTTLRALLDCFDFGTIQSELSDSLVNALPPVSQSQLSTSVIVLECVALGYWNWIESDINLSHEIERIHEVVIYLPDGYGCREKGFLTKTSNLHIGVKGKKDIYSGGTMFQVNNMELLLVSENAQWQLCKIARTERPNPMDRDFFWSRRLSPQTTALWLDYSAFRCLSKLSFTTCFLRPLKDTLSPNSTLDWKGAWVKQPWDLLHDDTTVKQGILKHLSLDTHKSAGSTNFEVVDGLTFEGSS